MMTDLPRTREEMLKVFCPTGEGGGIDPTCSPGETDGDEVTLYRGWAVGGKGHYFTTDREWARQFTQSGQDKEIQQVKLKHSDIYKAPTLPRAFGTDDTEMDKVISLARSKGFKAIWVDEGSGQPNSVFMIKPIRPLRKDEDG
jgi:hypothetical protein